MKRAESLMSGLAASLVFVGAASADVVTYQQGASGYTHDATQARGNEPASTFGSSVNLDIGKITDGVPSTPDSYRLYFAFDLLGIPAGATITDATLALTLKGLDADQPPDSIEVHRITAAAPIAEAGLSWEKYDGVNDWTTDGGDFDATVLASIFGQGTPGDVHTWTSPLLASAAQDALDNDAARLELILISPTAEASATAVRYRTYHSDDATTLSQRPLLTITYTIPEPATLSVLALSGAAALWRRRTAAGRGA